MYRYHGEVKVHYDGVPIKIVKEGKEVLHVPYHYKFYMPLNEINKLHQVIDKYENRRLRQKKRAKHSLLFISSIGLVFVLARYFEVDAFVRGSEIVLGAVTHFVFHTATEGFAEEEEKEREKIKKK